MKTLVESAERYLEEDMQDIKGMYAKEIKSLVDRIGFARVILLLIDELEYLKKEKPESKDFWDEAQSILKTIP